MAPPIRPTRVTTSTLLTQLRSLLDLTHTEIQVAETRVVQARTDAVRTELQQNANHARIRAEAIEKAIREPAEGHRAVRETPSAATRTNSTAKTSSECSCAYPMSKVS